jgi:hypothetical protein
VEGTRERERQGNDSALKWLLLLTHSLTPEEVSWKISCWTLDAWIWRGGTLISCLEISPNPNSKSPDYLYYIPVQIIITVVQRNSLVSLFTYPYSTMHEIKHDENYFLYLILLSRFGTN